MLVNLRSTLGQSQLLSVLMISGTMLSMGLFTLDRALKTQETAIKSVRVTEMRKALEGALQRASTIYRNEATCDPALFQRRLGGIQRDGSISTTPSTRVLDVTLNSRTYEVSFGAVTPILGGAPEVASTSQDVELELWTSTPNAHTSGGQKTSIRAVLLNTCQIKCDVPLPRAGKTADFEVCVTASEDAVSLRGVTDLLPVAFLSVPTGPNARIVSERIAIPCSSDANRFLGDIPIKAIYDDEVDAGLINALDYSVLTQYLQQHDTNWLVETTSLDATPVRPGCADLNLDGQLDETDRNILLKYLRGYIYRLPTHPTFF
jgi:hypothetical protein